MTGLTEARLEPLRTLIPASARPPRESRGEPMPAELAERYGGSLAIPLQQDRPAIIANFVSTLDGVVAFDPDGSSGGGEVSGFHEPDRFVMGLLRALADVVIVGAGTVRAAPGHRWTADHVNPRFGAAYAAWREGLGLARHPTTMVVTASGDLPSDHPGLRDPSVPVVILTTPHGASRANDAGFGRHVEVVPVHNRKHVSPRDIVRAAVERGASVVLCEGGPHVLGQLLQAQLVDELFLTLAPQIAGRDRDTARLALVEGSAFAIDTAPWADLRSVHRSDHHLFLRYAFDRLTGAGEQEEHRR